MKTMVAVASLRQCVHLMIIIIMAYYLMLTGLQLSVQIQELVVPVTNNTTTNDNSRSDNNSSNPQPSPNLPKRDPSSLKTDPPPSTRNKTKVQWNKGNTSYVPTNTTKTSNVPTKMAKTSDVLINKEKPSDAQTNTTKTSKDSTDRHRCPPKPPTAIQRRGKAWVQIDEYTVTKVANGQKEYLHEKTASQMLSPYPNFVTLLSWDDDCGLLVFERLFPAKGWKTPLLMEPKLDNWSVVENQIDEIWKVYERLRMEPSVEFLMGLNNIYIGTTGNVTMFDFHAYHWEGDGSKEEFKFNQTLNNELKDKLLAQFR